ncbi:MAG: dockerin type I domain-containing protein [Candidatus Thorarchaeota archaeon]
MTAADSERDGSAVDAAAVGTRPADWTFEEWIKETPPDFQNQFAQLHPAPHPVGKLPGPFDKADWAAIIDSVWGPGLSWETHAYIWQYMWDDVDTSFAGFFGLDPDIWDTVWNRYWPEIQDTVSKGRLAAIIWYAHWELSELHAGMADVDVLFTQPAPGVPLLLYGGVGVNDHFGAALTPLPDSSLLVYKAVENQPLGLVPGDIVLGYDGIPWKDIYPALMAAELPEGNSYHPGNTKAAQAHGLLTACGVNWHLFDSIDVVQHSTGDTMRLSTSPLEGQNISLYATEQLEIPGVPPLDIASGDVTTWGVIDGTDIGYIYSLGWFPHSDSALIVNEWLRALDSLQNVYGVCGLIIDIRTNFGTNLDFTRIHSYFYDDTLDLVGFAKRIFGGGHFDMEDGTGISTEFDLTINGDPSTYWDKPIAILTGPSAASGGDMFPLLLSFHPIVKVFGKTSGSAFSLFQGKTPFSGWIQARNRSTMFLASDSGNYINRKPFPNPTDFPWVDFEEVWLTQDGVINGQDDVVEAAMAWMGSMDTDQDCIPNEIDNCPDAYNPGQEDTDEDGIGDACDFLCGDSNGDGSINVSDAVFLINYVFKGGPPPDPLEAGDANCDSGISVADAVYIINFVFKSGPDPCAGCP